MEAILRWLWLLRDGPSGSTEIQPRKDPAPVNLYSPDPVFVWGDKVQHIWHNSCLLPLTLLQHHRSHISTLGLSLSGENNAYLQGFFKKTSVVWYNWKKNGHVYFLRSKTGDWTRWPLAFYQPYYHSRVTSLSVKWNTEYEKIVFKVLSISLVHKRISRKEPRPLVPKTSE